MVTYKHLYSTQVKSCVTCKHGNEDGAKDIICTNIQSNYCTEFVERGFQCRCWEGFYETD